MFYAGDPVEAQSNMVFFLDTDRWTKRTVLLWVPLGLYG
jgi:hypothetical protein